MTLIPAFYVSNGNIHKLNANFEWKSNLSQAQKRKSIEKLHDSLGGKALEVSSRSEDKLCKKLSPLKLKYKGQILENIFHSSKVFQLGGPFRDLLNVSARDAKSDQRFKKLGLLTGFELDGYTWPIVPKTVFYDYIYCQAVKESLTEDEIREIASYDFFTDTKYNPERNVNTQARALSIIKMMVEMYGMLPDIKSPEEFIRFHTMFVKA